MTKFLQSDKEGTLLPGGAMSIAELEQALAEVTLLEQRKRQAVERERVRKQQLFTEMARKMNDLRQVELQKREAINKYRPIKRQYVHSYRTQCITEQ